MRIEAQMPRALPDLSLPVAPAGAAAGFEVFLQPAAVDAAATDGAAAKPLFTFEALGVLGFGRPEPGGDASGRGAAAMTAVPAGGLLEQACTLRTSVSTKIRPQVPDAAQADPFMNMPNALPACASLPLSVTAGAAMPEAAHLRVQSAEARSVVSPLFGAPAEAAPPANPASTVATIVCSPAALPQRGRVTTAPILEQSGRAAEKASLFAQALRAKTSATDISVTVAETTDGCHVVAVLPELTESARQRLQSLADELATEFGLAFRSFLVNGAPLARPVSPRGSLA